MILVDASVWIDHFRTPNDQLTQLFETRDAWTHPFVVGELAMGSLRNRRDTLRHLGKLPSVALATVAEVAAFVEWEKLYSKRLSYIDAHLLASTRFSDGVRLWSRDRALRAEAARLGVAYEP
jgi:predicted nucleic acid-binding protein